jgi:hypothetical protein
MDINGVFSELRLEGLGDWLNIKTNSGSNVLKRKQWSNDIQILSRRAAQIGALRNSISIQSSTELNNAFETIKGAETAATAVLENIDSEKSKNNFADECYGQLLFRHELLKPINQIPFFLTVLRFWKIYVAPAMSIMMPLVAVILPYILIRFVFGLPMPVNAYVKIIKEFYSGNGFQGLMPTPEMDGQLASLRAQSEKPMDFFGKIKFYGQTLWLIVSFFQSIWQPIQSAKHLAVLDTTLCEQGIAIKNIFNAAKTIRDAYGRIGIKVSKLPFDESEIADARIAVATALDSPARLRILLELIGEWEVLYRLASHNEVCLVKWIKSERPYLALKNTFDIYVPVESRVTFNVDFNPKSHHALLTGPNRGGKSTALRAIGRSVWLAHNYGISVGTEASMTPLRWLQTCLRLEDIPGSASLFEREVAVASLALQRSSKNSHGLLLIDELFHSTNPPDAEIASKTFLKQLWTSKSTISVISTHMFSLLKEIPTNSSVQSLCCPAEYRPDGSVEYKYGLEHGICKVSSVLEILREKGFPLVSAEHIIQ